MKQDEQQGQELQAVSNSLPANVFADKEGFNQLVRVATAFSKTAIIPEAYRNKPEDCMVAIDMANRMGVPPLMVMQNLYVVKGKPTWAGQACMALIQSCGKFTQVRHTYTGDKGTTSRGCRVTAVRLDTGEVVEGPLVTMEMAKAEGWTSNPKWRNIPELMLAYRAAAFFARVHCPEALMGVQTAEEVEDVAQAKPDIPDVLAGEEEIP